MKQTIASVNQVGINAHLLSHQASYRSAGIHGYIHNLIRHLPAAAAGTGLQFTLFLGRGQVEGGDRLTIRRSSWPTGRPLARILWEQLVLPWQRMDLLHSAAFVAPVIAPWPTVITVYDLSFAHYPQALTAGRRAYLGVLGRYSCRRARQVIAISQSTRRDIVKQWGIPADRIVVAYPGVGDEFRPLPAGEVSAFRARRNLPEQFILHLGTLQPRKNLVRLIQAYGRLGTDAKLVLAGGRGWLYEEILSEIEKLNLHHAVLLPGYVPDEELPLWYNAATLLAYPSLYEGFGLPVVEAMACGTPVVTSNVSSLPEAAGESEAGAALLVNPHDVDELAAALHSALNDQSLQDQLRDRGFRQAARFGWQETAAATVAAYQRALEVRP